MTQATTAISCLSEFIIEYRATRSVFHVCKLEGSRIINIDSCSVLLTQFEKYRGEMEKWHLIFNILQVFTIADTLEMNLTCCTEDMEFVIFGGEEASCVNRNNDTIRYGLDINCTTTVVVRNVTKIDDLGSLSEYCYINQEVNDSFLIGYCQKPEWESEIDYFFVPLSILSLIIVFVIYVRIKTLRQPEDIAFMIFILMLILFLLLETIDQFFVNFIDGASFIQGIMFTKYYSSLGSFVWLNVVFICQLRKNM